MKLILVTLLILAVSRADPWTIMERSGTGEKITLELAPSASDATKTDITYVFSIPTAGKPLADSSVVYVAWVNTGASDFSLTPPQTGMKGNFFALACSGPCPSTGDISTRVLYASDTFSWDGTTLSTTSKATPEIIFGNTALSTVSNTATTLTLHIPDQVDADLTTWGFPTSSENFYYKCWSSVNNTSPPNLNYPIADVSTGNTLLNVAAERNLPTPTPTPTPTTPTPTTPTTQTTPTSRAEVVAILAAAGSGLASFFF